MVFRTCQIKDRKSYAVQWSFNTFTSFKGVCPLAVQIDRCYARKPLFAVQKSQQPERTLRRHRRRDPATDGRQDRHGGVRGRYGGNHHWNCQENKGKGGYFSCAQLGRTYVNSAPIYHLHSSHLQFSTPLPPPTVHQLRKLNVLNDIYNFKILDINNLFFCAVVKC